MYALIIRNTLTGERKRVESPFEWEVGEILYRAEIVGGFEKLNEYEIEDVREVLVY